MHLKKQYIYKISFAGFNNVHCHFWEFLIGSSTGQGI